MDGQVEHEICANCKKEIPHYNYVMHTVHCARNITLCKNCKEPIPKTQFEEHQKKCQVKPAPKPAPPPTDIEKSDYYSKQKAIEDAKVAQRKERYLERLEKFLPPGNTLGTVARNGPSEAPSPSLTPCKYCELELPGGDLEQHESYCGARTDKCRECGEIVMFKYKQLHEDTNHGFLKLNDEPGPRPSWDSNTARTPKVTTTAEPSYCRRRPSPLLNFSSSFDLPYVTSPPPAVAATAEKKESYKEISRRLDCKTEYIRNLLHDSASITVPLRSNGAVPRNHFNHNKGPAPQPPASRRRNPPTELEIPCEFCGTPIPHDDLIRHETGCRPDLARFNPRRAARSPSPDYFEATAAPSSPEVELPCEFCSDMIPASQLLRHQATCL